MCVAVSASLALAPMARAAPAGDEYLPEVPQAAGDEVAAGAQGSGAPIVSPEAQGEPADTSPKDAGAKDTKDKDESETTTVDAAAATGSDDEGGGSGGTLLNPVVLLLLIGAITAAVGMTLRRRRHDEDGDGQGPRPARDRAKPTTPDGEIVAGEQQP